MLEQLRLLLADCQMDGAQCVLLGGGIMLIQLAAGLLDSRTDGARSPLPASAVAFEKILLVLVVADLALGGNGYLTTFGGARLRSILFFICVPWALLRVTMLDRLRPDPDVWSILFPLLCAACIGAFVGYVNDAPLSAIFAELKPLAYLPMLLFFAVAIRTTDDVKLVVVTLVAGGSAVGLVYLATLLAAYSHLIVYGEVFNMLSGSDEFLFRHVADTQAPFVGFLYKGMIYVCPAVILLLTIRRSWKLAFILIVAVALALTRSLYLGLTASFIVGAILDRKQLPVLAAALLLLSAAAFVGLTAERSIVERPPPPVIVVRPDTPAVKQPTETAPDANQDAASAKPPVEITPGASIDRSAGVAGRLKDVLFVLENTSFVDLVLGHGLGAEINGRPRIEMSYFEIAYKQSLYGLLPWFLPLAYMIHLYRRVREPRDTARAFLLVAIFVYLTNITLPIMSGSIGMGLLFISAVVIRAELGTLPRQSRPIA